MEIEGTEASHEVGIDSTSGVYSPHPAPPPRLSAAPLRCCISTQFWVSVCLAEPWIIKDIFLTPVWFCAGAAVCPLCFVVWGWEVKGRKLASVKWGEGAGLISAVSELRAPRAAACCPRGAQGRVRKCCGSCEKQGLENERPRSPGGPSPSRESLSYSQWHRDNPGSVCVTKITEASDQLVPLDGEGAMALHLHWRPCSMDGPLRKQFELFVGLQKPLGLICHLQDKLCSVWCLSSELLAVSRPLPPMSPVF